MIKVVSATLICAAWVLGCSGGPLATSPPPTARATPVSTPAPTPTAAPTASPAATTAQPTATPLATTPLRDGPLLAGTYWVEPFVGTDLTPCGLIPTGATPPPCPGATKDDSIRFTFTVPEGWAGAFNSLWLADAQVSPPGAAGMIMGRGGWLHSDPCLTDAQIELNGGLVDIPVGPTVDDFANALAEHPLLDVTAPVDVTLAGYSGKYVDLQIPADISACPTSYFPWEGGRGLYAQGPGNRWHLWILDVNGVRVVIQTHDYAGTSPQRQSELETIVASIQIEP
jgi:hypothetical protein